MKRAWVIGITVAGLIAGAMVHAQSPRSAEVQMKAAQRKAEVEGDLKGAIEEYKKAVAAAGRNRALAAQALLRMAECYQKLGDAEAGRIYAQVVREYADQAEAASVARTRLARIPSSSGAAGIVTRQVWTGPNLDFTGTISSDGRYLSFRESSSWGVALHDLSTGRDRLITDNPDADTWAFAMHSAISPDGRQVAFSRRTKDGATRELRVVSIAGNAPAPSRLLYNDPNTSEIRPHAWSPDGRWIAVQRRTRDDEAQIGLVNAESGALRVLKSWRGHLSNRLSCSPDGRHLAFDLPADDRTASRDVFVLALDTGREIPVVVHAANDTVVGWTPDGGRLLFASNRSGANGLWALPWRDGRPSGDAALVMANVNLGEPLGITRAGALYYGVTTSLSDVYLLSINPESGVVLSPPTRAIEQPVGGHTSPDWSADGRLLSYFVSGGIAIRAMDTGETRELKPALTGMSNPRLSPDGRSLAVIATDPANGRRGIFHVDAQTGETTRLIESPADIFPFLLSWMPDGRSLIYRNIATTTNASVAVHFDLAARTERTVLDAHIVSMSLSADGLHLAYVTDKPSWQLMVVPTAGGDPRPVALPGVPTPLMVMAWTPDDRHLLLQAASTDSKPAAQSTDLWLVSRDGGQPRKVDLKLQFGGATQARFNPRTGQLAITAIESRREVWVMENIPGRF